ncbi:hypothetical protein GLOTRDRAFT_121418 [Gloeophyllum trabeum ATCC 11539]|uniref:Uncharacterized protein n=1 Tax=Gloeophyllum trabeum (strain ATCC 11539 / FP-39264 / Madison 617) TaxID=670483 RepID=S7Q6U3_GLOTA|nr:uncharacterized protein GLOTRDRAFT_121418 [Gloeophyllum trabeum ATCC 11539]EPQ55148.1 hypothetical protein GLOTRDRAFT_121418 [Gloeophyllum trabeum ATCC 11539]
MANVADVRLACLLSNVAQEDIFSLPTDEIVRRALQRLAEHTQLIVWGSLLDRRMRLPRIQKAELHIDKLEALSAMLTQMTLPVATLPNSVVSTEGDFLRRGRLHRVTRATDCFGMQCLHLMPAPLPGYTEDDLEPAPLDGTSLTMYVPRPSAVYAGILRMMLKYPRWCAEQYKLQADLELLVYYNMLGPEKMSAGYELEEREMDRRGMEAAEPVRGWGREGQWREGEEWMEDALVGIVTGEKDITSLPHLGTMAHGKIA